ncbi:hypothetical protein [Enterococcus sp.]|uniref:hypothetical protein n=1 Tax=Enterococcus sp. TaxID=35783 RepID=UPI0029069EE7|nr:hypothetical protein [Enterococcus sp.]MDU5333431.1 hypothetical protein [Enterococcus sp.]
MEYAIAVLVREALTTNDFSFFLYELIRELFLHYEPSDTMRKFCSFFERYFEEKEFDTIISRVFGSKNEYFKNGTDQPRVSGKSRNWDIGPRVRQVSFDLVF